MRSGAPGSCGRRWRPRFATLAWRRTRLEERELLAERRRRRQLTVSRAYTYLEVPPEVGDTISITEKPCLRSASGRSPTRGPETRRTTLWPSGVR